MLREEEWRREMAKKMVETLEENVKEAKEEKTTEKKTPAKKAAAKKTTKKDEIKEEVKEEPPKEETIDLFKEEEVPKKIEVPEPIPKETAEVSKKASSIYDMLVTERCNLIRQHTCRSLSLSVGNCLRMR